MTPELFLDIGLNPALRLLPPQMDSPQARAMVMCVVLHESALAARRQHGGGPARGYGQFEKTGIRGVLTHRASKRHAVAVCKALNIAPTINAVYVAIEFNDVLLVAFMRLLLRTLPDALPHRGQVGIGWSQYLDAWRPGAVLKKPANHPERIALRKKWGRNFDRAWNLVAPVYNSEGRHSS